MSAGLISPVMLGRGEQLAALKRFFDGVCTGSPAVALLGGEAGAGKTRLIAEFAHVVAGQAVLLSGACVDLGGAGLAFAPFTAALRGLVRQLGAEGVASLVPGSVPTGLGRLLPALGGRVPQDSGSDGDAGAARARLFEELLGLLENLADQEPVVLVVEDVHWADRSSRELISFLARNLQPATALLILVSYRTDDLDRAHPLRPLLAELERLPSVHRVELPRLSRREVIGQIRGILGGPGPAGLIEEVARRSDGNPLFVEVLLDSRGQLPESLADLLLARVRRLPEGTQQLLGAAAVAGARFGDPLLEAASGLSEAALSDALRPAVVAGVLVTDDEAYAFRHALIREAVQAGQLPGERRRWHARLAQILEADPALASGTAVAEIAHHWHAAGEPARALPAAWRAAADAAAALAYAEQLVMLDRVLELWDAVPDAAGLTGVGRLRVLEQAVTAAHLAGEPGHGVLLADTALAEPGIQADPVRAFFISERRAAMSLHLRQADVAGLQQAADRVADDDPARPRVLAALAEQLMDAQLPEQACEQGEQALAAARRGRDLIAEASALITVAALAARRGALAAARRVLEVEGARAARLKRFLWPLLATTARVACLATAPGSPDELTALARVVLRLAAGQAASVQPVSPVGRALEAAYRAAAGQATARQNAGRAAVQPDGSAWDGVASAWEQLGEPYRRARALVNGSEAALAAGADRGAVAERLRQAADLADALAARPLRDEISSLARRARIDLAHGEVSARTSASLGLTDRELEVLRLVADGRNNRDIAAGLFISAKTASVHVSNILAKLGVHSRVEAAAIAHQAGITSTA